MRHVCTALIIVALALPSPPQPARATPQATLHRARADSLAVNQTEYDGWKLYHTYCDRCHGQDAVGTSFAPNLRRSVGPDGSVSHDVFIQKTSDGVLDKGMPAWKGTLTPPQIEDIWAYLRARSTGRLAAGRPHLVSGASPAPTSH